MGSMLNTIKAKMNPAQVHKLKQFGSSLNRLGFNFAIFDTDSQLVFLEQAGRYSSDKAQITEWAIQTLEQAGSGCDDASRERVYRFGQDSRSLSIVLGAGDAIAGVALVDLGYEKSEQYVELFSQMMTLLAENFSADMKSAQQIEMLGTELAQVYEELVLLHKLGTNMNVTESDASFLQMACDNLTDIVSVEGIAILVERTVDDQKQLILTAGSGVIDVNEHLMMVLHERLLEELSSGKEALLDSEVDSPFKYDWSNSIRNIIAVPLYGKTKSESEFDHKHHHIIGMMVAVNRLDRPDFDSTDIKLFNSVASSCAVFIENGRLFKDLKELFVGSLKALTSSIDAKDQYTRGHSERVAFISKWIAEELAQQENLSEEQIHKVYLAGLLHDIGKMGVSESILRKNGKLTDEERAHIKAHPAVGASILSGIKQMRDIVPGILCHHERVDGLGYPNGLKGDKMPLIGKIVSLADAFDAMTSRRTYRDAMPVEKALAEIENQLGTHFDEKVGKAFINSDVYKLWDMIQNGSEDIYETNDSEQYGAIAIGSLIK